MSDNDDIVVEGHWAVEALIDAERFKIRSVSIESGRHADLVDHLERIQIPFSILSPTEVRDEAGYDFHRGVLARVERPAASELTEDFLANARQLVVPVGIADPGNIGTIIRSAVAFGADGILLERGKGADPWGRKSIRASARAIFRVPIFEVDDLAHSLTGAGKLGFTLYGTSLREKARPLHEAEPAAKKAVLFGAEQDGLSSPLEDVCDQLLCIPMANEMDSLNVAASAAIVCHELFVKR